VSELTHKCREVIPLVASFCALVLALGVVWFYLIKPWPGVQSSNDWKLVDPPPAGVYQPGQLLTWQKPEVCTPEGETTVQFLARRQVPPGAFDYLMYTRILRYPVASCNSPNVTRIVIPEDLASGRYDVLVRACTDTPNPRDTCIEVEGPTFNLLNPTFGSSGP
jgi:hypothetical protein